MNGSLFINKTYSRNEIKGLLEGILFVNGKYMNLQELESIFETSKEDVQKLIAELNEDYTTRRSGFSIVPVAGGYQLLSSPHYKDELTELFGKRNENKLPKSSLETLAIIAYKQPMSKEEIDKIRGVSSSRSINTLLALKLITISGSAENMVKSPLYSTTSRFLEFFRIQSIDDLPSLSSIELNHFLEEFEEDEEAEEAEEQKQESDGNIFENK